MESDLDPARIEAGSFVRAVEFHPEIASTNDRALAVAASGELPLPGLILAERQTGGRGRRSNRWWSGDGAITCSLVLDAARQRLSADQWPHVALLAGLAICRSLEGVLPGERFGLKWPNDVYFDERKVCGILVEAGTGLCGPLVIGMGINVNNSFADAPDELRMTAVSLADRTGLRFDRSTLLIDVLRQFEGLLTRLAGLDESLLDEWQSRCFLSGRNIQLQAGERLATGTCRGIDRKGALVLQTEHGVERFFGGTVVAFT